MPATKPKLPALTTPVTGSFPAEAIASAVSSKTPLSAVLRDPLASAGLPSAGLPSAGIMSPYSAMAMVKTEDCPIKTPISPPVAYLDFLKSASSTSRPTVPSPPLTGVPAKSRLERTSTSDSANSNSTCKTASSDSILDDDFADQDLVDSGPSTATSQDSDCSCDRGHSRKTSLGRGGVASPFAAYPLSAPATGQASFPSLKVPPSPAMGNVDSPVQSPFSARSIKSSFDWEAALKARRYADSTKTANGGHRLGCSKSKPLTSPRASVRHIREVVTRTVTYTPKMDPAPKGKRRKVQ